MFTALREERLRPRAASAKDVMPAGVGPSVVAIVYDLAPWNDEARRLLRRLRRDPVPDLPALLYAPPRHEVGPLLMEAGRLPIVWGELQCDGPG
ncbi:MAG: hypothetical protein ACREME_10480, partial [Gemmatimonadales bacterium]